MSPHVRRRPTGASLALENSTLHVTDTFHTAYCILHIAYCNWYWFAFHFACHINILCCMLYIHLTLHVTCTFHVTYYVYICHVADFMYTHTFHVTHEIYIWDFMFHIHVMLLMYTRMFLSLFLSFSLCFFLSLSLSLFLPLSLSLSLPLHVYICIHMYVCMYIYVCMYVCMSDLVFYNFMFLQKLYVGFESTL